MVPQLTDPPDLLSLDHRDFRPSFAAWIAAFWPAVPEPMTSSS